MRALAASALLLVFFLASNAFGADLSDAMAAYKSGDYTRALPLLQAAVADAPQDEAANAALLSTLVYQGQVDAASDAAVSDEKKFPNSPIVVAARGEFAYYMGDMAKAEALFRAAIRLKEPTPRAYLGLFRLYEAASMSRTARLLILRAHAIDPDDAVITLHWLAFAPAEKQREIFRSFAEAHPWFFPNINIARVTRTEASKQPHRRKTFELEGDAKEVTLPLIPIYNNSRRGVEALGLPFRLNNGHVLTLILDTGASGILISQSTADKAGVGRLGSLRAGGIGDGEAKNGFAAVADSCAIGALGYKACLLRVAEGDLRLTEGEDGLIGTDVFSDYLVEIDFRKHQLHLTPQPPRDPNPEGYDAKPPGDGWTRVYRYGHLFFVPTDLNGKGSGLFLIDSGAVMSSVDSTFARLSTKLHTNSAMQIHGLSGDVKDVFQADKAVITFAGYRQKNIGLTSFNLNNFTGHRDVRIDGILGFSVLDLFRLTLDYRNGLVKFEYKRK
ncbi:MAG TPA: aspartyl protease family protein [Bryobacteraceae bacterium]|nr:aspartyl protease family protein [Bryobacteraceae bacterium]